MDIGKCEAANKISDDKIKELKKENISAYNEINNNKKENNQNCFYKNNIDSEKAKKIAYLQAKQYIYEAVEKMQEKIEDLLDPTSEMSNSERERYDRRIMAKIYSGQELTPEELRYVRVHYPALYPQVMRVQLQRKAFKEKLKNVHSKQEAIELFNEAMSHISEEDPVCEALEAAYKEVFKEFKNSSDYSELKDSDSNKVLKTSLKNQKNTKDDVNYNTKDNVNDNKVKNNELGDIKFEQINNELNDYELTQKITEYDNYEFLIKRSDEVLNIMSKYNIIK